MKRHFLFILILLGSITAHGQKVAQGQNYQNIKCIYNLTFQPDSTNSSVLRMEKYFLFMSNGKSKFQAINSFLLDSLLLSASEHPPVNSNVQLSSLPDPYFTYTIIKENNNIATYDNIYTIDYKYTETNPFRWTITTERRTIAGYTCQRATTSYAGRTYDAWFTKEIPACDGPYKFMGLPGLIIKIQDTRKHYSFEMITLNRTKQDIKLIPLKAKITPTTRVKFLNSWRNFHYNAIDIMAQNGWKYGDYENQKIKYKERIKRENNFIELKY